MKKVPSVYSPSIKTIYLSLRAQVAEGTFYRNSQYKTTIKHRIATHFDVLSWGIPEFGAADYDLFATSDLKVAKAPLIKLVFYSHWSMVGTH